MEHMRGEAAPLPAASADASVGPRLEAERGLLWGLAYRLTGNAADADDVVQETYLRALRRPPADREAPWRPWLVRVALNVGRDLLRRRRRHGYVGPWLPSPIEAEPPSHEPADPSGDPAARYDMLESVSFAFLLALEALTPMQRAVLLLRDVFDYSAREAARALGTSEANVRTVHLRARRAMAEYDTARRPPSTESVAAERQALERFLASVAAGDVTAVESLLADEVRALSDGGGEFAAARAPVVGRRKVAALFVGLARQAGPHVRFEPRLLNGRFAVVADREVPRGQAPRFTLQAELDGEGRLLRLYTVLATRKLTAVA